LFESSSALADLSPDGVDVLGNVKRLVLRETDLALELSNIIGLES
jgi:hypothetical protein